MNYRLLAKYLGLFAAGLGLLFLPAAGVSLLYREWLVATEIGIATLLAMMFGGALFLVGRNAPPTLYQREALGLVGLTWLLASALGTLPYLCTGVLGFADAVFESASGFTTTGASVITEIEDLPKGILFWRMLSHWLGGLGIIVLFIAVLPYLGAGGKQLYKSETTGPDPRGLRPRIKESAKLLYRIYLGFTAIMTLLLWAAGMNFFDALTHAFSTIATGGFSTRNASIGAYDSVLIEGICIVFMTAAATNFGLYLLIIGKQWKAMFRDTEWRAYMLILTVCTLLIALNLSGKLGQADLPHHREATGEFVATTHYNFAHALRVAAFQTVSITTSTGYATDDFDTWPNLARMLLIALMFMGGCAGSTAGGFKVVRIIMLFKFAIHRIENTFRPKTIRAVRMSGHVIDDDVQKMVSAFFILYVSWFAFGSVVMSLFGLPFATSVTSVIACLSNIGPGLEMVGAAANYGFMPGAAKFFLSLCMVLGRLELFTLCVMLMPSFWRVGR